MTKEELDCLEYGDIIEFPVNCGWVDEGQQFEYFKCDENEYKNYYVRSYNDSSVSSLGYWRVPKTDMLMCLLIKKVNAPIRNNGFGLDWERSHKNKCPLCDGDGEDLVFAFYCSNEKCRNFK